MTVAFPYFTKLIIYDLQASEDMFKIASIGIDACKRAIGHGLTKYF